MSFATVAGGLGLGTWAQCVPFQLMMKVLTPVPPTAHASLADTALTAFSNAPPAGLGQCTLATLVPFQCTTDDSPLTPMPTDQASAGESALTLSSGPRYFSGVVRPWCAGA